MLLSSTFLTVSPNFLSEDFNYHQRDLCTVWLFAWYLKKKLFFSKRSLVKQTLNSKCRACQLAVWPLPSHSPSVASKFCEIWWFFFFFMLMWTKEFEFSYLTEGSCMLAVYEIICYKYFIFFKHITTFRL